MARSKSDISNSAIRIFLQQVGTFYDELRNLEPYRPTKKQKAVLLQWFDNRCCYCGEELTDETMGQDHLVPMNKESLGLHAWGNVVPSCLTCNKVKHDNSWQVYLKTACKDDLTLNATRLARILRFLEHYNYEPNLQLQAIATNLYEDVGEVAMTLIKLRYKQAEEVIRQLQHTRGQGPLPPISELDEQSKDPPTDP